MWWLTFNYRHLSSAGTRSQFTLWHSLLMASTWLLDRLTSASTFGTLPRVAWSTATKELVAYLRQVCFSFSTNSSILTQLSASHRFVGTAVETKLVPVHQMEPSLSWICVRTNNKPSSPSSSLSADLFSFHSTFHWNVDYYVLCTYVWRSTYTCGPWRSIRLETLTPRRMWDAFVSF